MPRLWFCAPLLAACLCVWASGAGRARPAETSVYQPSQTFAPLSFPDAVNRYRSANGAPGPDYWQNRADYEIHAALDPAAKTITRHYDH